RRRHRARTPRTTRTTPAFRGDRRSPSRCGSPRTTGRVGRVKGACVMSTAAVIVSNWKPTGDGAAIPEFPARLRREPPAKALRHSNVLAGAETNGVPKVCSCQPSLTAERIKDGQAAWVRPARNDTFDDWCSVAAALAEIRTLALRKVGANKPQGRRYN